MRSRCQKAIAAHISEQEADYVLALKGNHGNLHREIADYFYWAQRQKAGAVEVDEYRSARNKDTGALKNGTSL